jgi:predicted DNA-binding protein (MmcQ/YjbR family)
MLQSYEGLTAYIEDKPSVTSDFPFGFDTRVFRVGKKIFVLMAWEQDPIRISLKAEPTDAVILRQTYGAVTPGYHLNKQHWNTIVCDGSVPDEEVQHMIDESYRLIFAGLPKEIRSALTMESKFK